MSGLLSIRPAGPGDAQALDHALQHLSSELEDPHRVGPAHITAAAFEGAPIFYALIAEENIDTSETGIVGFTFMSPVFSSVRGGPGTFISDLWVAPSRRGTGLGRRLLASAANFGKAHWGALFLKLSVYDRSPESQAFYAKLGFSEAGYEKVLYLTEDGYQRLAGAS